jgi:hypothetical protein
VIASTPFKQNGWYPEVLAGMASMDAEATVGSPMFDAYVRAAPRPEDWPRLIAKVRQLLTAEAYDWAQDVVAIKAPTLIVIGDADSIRLAHAVELFGLLGGGKRDGDALGLPPSQLAVLAGTTHSSVLFRTALLLPTILPFLDNGLSPSDSEV